LRVNVCNLSSRWLFPLINVRKRPSTRLEPGILNKVDKCAMLSFLPDNLPFVSLFCPFVTECAVPRGLHWDPEREYTSRNREYPGITRNNCPEQAPPWGYTRGFDENILNLSEL